MFKRGSGDGKNKMGNDDAQVERDMATDQIQTESLTGITPGLCSAKASSNRQVSISSISAQMTMVYEGVSHGGRAGWCAVKRAQRGGIGWAELKYFKMSQAFSHEELGHGDRIRSI